MIGDELREINIKVFPYFKTFIGFETKRGIKPSNIAHSKVPYLDAILHASSHGLRTFFDLLPESIGAYNDVTEQLQLFFFEGIAEPLDWAKLRGQIHPAKRVIKEARLGYAGQKPLSSGAEKATNRACDACFLFIFHLLRTTFDEDTQEARSRAFQIASFIQARPEMFNERIRSLIPAVYTHVFRVSSSQVSSLGCKGMVDVNNIITMASPMQWALPEAP